MVSRVKTPLKRKTKRAAASNGSKPAERKTAEKGAVKVKPLQLQRLTLGLKSLSPMMQHKWAEKAKEQMRQKHAGVKAKNRDVRDPEAEFRDAAYRFSDGSYGILAKALKAAILSAAHKDMGLPRTVVAKSLRVLGDPEGDVSPLHPDALIAIDCDEPTNREDYVRVGNNSTDLRYRPYFEWWTAEVTFIFDSEWLTPEIIVNLIERAGFGFGIGEWRPEKGGDLGCFGVDDAVPMKCQPTSSWC